MAEQTHQAAVVEFDHVTKRYDAPIGQGQGQADARARSTTCR